MARAVRAKRPTTMARGMIVQRISSDLLPRIEACAKPVVAAMHGFAIGGGLELALACHYRIADRGTRIALPEIRHGVLPPSGSQRMPRAIGVARALALIVGGGTVAAETVARAYVTQNNFPWQRVQLVSR